MDPFSLSSSIAGVISLAIEVTKITTEYVSSVKGASKAVEGFRQEFATFTAVLQNFQKFINTQKPGGPFQETSVLITTLTACDEKLRGLRDLLHKQSSASNRLSKRTRRLVWPLRENECQEIVESLHRYAQIFQFSLTKDGWYVTACLVPRLLRGFWASPHSLPRTMGSG
jgi:hypothetical protein